MIIVQHWITSVRNNYDMINLDKINTLHWLAAKKTMPGRIPITKQLIWQGFVIYITGANLAPSWTETCQNLTFKNQWDLHDTVTNTKYRIYMVHPSMLNLNFHYLMRQQITQNKENIKIWNVPPKRSRKPININKVVSKWSNTHWHKHPKIYEKCKIIIGRNHKVWENDVNGDEIPKIIPRSELNLFLGDRYMDTKYPQKIK